MSSEETAPVRVALVDDQALIRSGLAMLVDSQPDLTVVAEAGSGREAVASVSVAGADVVLMDVRMPHMDGIEATRAIVADPSIDARVLMLTTFDADEQIFQAVQAGASGFLLKDVPPDDLVHAVRVVARGDALLAPAITRRLLERFVEVAPAAPGDPADDLEELTQREREVFALIARGRSNAEVAAQLHLAEATVKTHVTRMLSKLGARDRVQLVVLAYERGMVRPGGA